MSHGADTEDFEQALGSPLPQPPGGEFVDTPVMFLGIEPGGDYGNDELLPHPTLRHVEKMVPTRHYYWTVSSHVGWPTSSDQVKWVPGPFFAYLLFQFGLYNAYFSNIVKCRLWDDYRKDKNGQTSPSEVSIKPDKLHRLADSRIRRNCIKMYLKREVQIHEPVVIFVFGGRGMEILSDEPWLDKGLLVQLKHYAVVNYNQIKSQQYTKECEEIIRYELAQRRII